MMKLEKLKTKTEYIIRLTDSKGGVSEWRFRKKRFWNFYVALWRTICATCATLTAGLIGYIAGLSKTHPSFFLDDGPALVLITVLLTLVTSYFFAVVTISLDWRRKI